jgi:hypothetical protein
MRVVVESLVERDVHRTVVERLRVALEPATFADACCIGAMGGATVYLRCPDAPHGVIVNTAQLGPEYIRWILDALAGSVAASQAEQSVAPDVAGRNGLE